MDCRMFFLNGFVGAVVLTETLDEISTNFSCLECWFFGIFIRLDTLMLRGDGP
jgi:hypothetical protein